MATMQHLRPLQQVATTQLRLGFSLLEQLAPGDLGEVGIYQTMTLEVNELHRAKIPFVRMLGSPVMVNMFNLSTHLKAKSTRLY